MPFLPAARKPTSWRRPLGRAAFTLIELLAVIAVILVIATFTIPRLIRSRMVANEDAAVSALRTLGSANMIYWNSYQQGYAPSLAALAPPTGGGPPSASSADLIDAVLAGGTRGGYTYIYAAVDTNGNGQFDLFTINANPLSPGISGQRYFFVDQSHVVRFEVGGPANASSQPIPPM